MASYLTTFNAKLQSELEDDLNISPNITPTRSAPIHHLAVPHNHMRRPSIVICSCEDSKTSRVRFNSDITILPHDSGPAVCYRNALAPMKPLTAANLREHEKATGPISSRTSSKQSVPTISSVMSPVFLEKEATEAMAVVFKDEIKGSASYKTDATTRGCDYFCGCATCKYYEAQLNEQLSKEPDKLCKSEKQKRINKRKQRIQLAGRKIAHFFMNVGNVRS